MLKRNNISTAVVLAVAAALPTGAALAAGSAKYLQVDDDILDHELELASGEEVGEIEDLVIDRDGTVRYVLLERGGFLDIGDQNVAVPWKSIQLSSGNDWTISMSEAELQNVPRYDRDRNVDWTDSEIVGEIAAFFGAEAEQIPGPPLRVEDDLLDRDLKLASGEDLGEVEEVVVDRDGHARYVVIEPDGLDLDQEVIVLPWKALQNTGEGLVVNLGKDDFRSVPGFDDADEIDWDDERLVSDIASFWEPVEEAVTPER